ncbi:MAG: CARDB domain-containing protein, partial [Thermomicrobiales bacterium]
ITVLCTELTITKTPDDGFVNPGGTAEFVITVTNVGSFAAQDVSISDTLPAGTWTVEVLDQPSAQANVVDGVLTVTMDALPAGETLTVRVYRTVTTADCGPIPNTASVGFSNPAPGVDTQPTDSAQITVTCSEVSIVKTPKGATVNAGDTATFTITATNNGTYPATGVVIEDYSLPAGDWNVEVTQGQAGTVVDCGPAVATGSFTCTLDQDLAVDWSIEITVSRVTSDNDCTTLTNDVRISATNEVPNATDNNEDTGSITVNCADLWVEKYPTDERSTINANDDIGFTIVVHNDGEGTANDVTVNDVLPTGIDWSLVAPVTGCAIETDINSGVQTLVCDLGDLAPDAQVEIEVTGTTDPTDCGVIENTVTISASNVDGTPPEGQDDPLSATASVTVNCPDLAIEKTTSTPQVSAGDQISFTITVTNNGVGTAYGVQVTDTLPTTVTGWTEDSVDCEIAAGELTCDFGDLAYTESASVTITGTTSNVTCATVTNEATASAENFLNDEEEPTNEVSDDATVNVDCPDIEVTKSAETAEIYPGESAQFTITVTNNGPGNAKGVQIVDDLWIGNWTVAPDAGITCDAVNGIASGTLTCTLDADLAPEASLSIVVSRVVTVFDCGIIQNDVSVTATNEDPAFIGIGNSDSATVEILCTELILTKSAESEVINAGDDATFTIEVWNAGINLAKDVVVTDAALPSGTWNFSAPEGVSCVPFRFSDRQQHRYRDDIDHLHDR